MPLAGLARAFACFATGRDLSPGRAAAAQRLRAACAAKPWFCAGTGRFDTDVMGVLGKRVFTKSGAEGMFCAALPEHGLGIAIKCDDGGGRAAEVAMAATLAKLLPDDRATLEPFVRPTLRNWNGIVVGQLRPTDAI